MRFLLMALALFFAFPALAEQPKLPKALEQQQLAGGQVIYLGQHGSMHGWVLVRRGQPEFYYAPEDGSALVLGILFDNEGRAITPSQVSSIQADAQRSIGNMVTPANPAKTEPVQASENAPESAPESTPQNTSAVAVAPAPALQIEPIIAEPAKPAVAPTPARQLFNDVSNGAKLLWGKPDAPMIYAFIDPNCSHCGRFMEDITPFVNEGRISVQILPAGFRTKSVNQAAFMLAAADGVERLLRYKAGDASALPDDDITTTAVDHNMGILTDWDLRLTPVILYETPNKDIRLVRGRPFDVPAMVKDALGE